MVTIGVIRFPGTNNEWETLRALESFNVEAKIIEYFEEINDLDGVWLAGGFSYGDVLRAGAIAGASPILKQIKKTTTPVFGACNGFQILTEAGILEGALLPNASTRFICKWVRISILENNSYLNELAGEVLKVPIAHFEGNYWNKDDPKNAIAVYSDHRGNSTIESNPNGSIKNIAGIASNDGRVIGMMPHPERSCFPHQGSIDGRKIIDAFIKEVKC